MKTTCLMGLAAWFLAGAALAGEAAAPKGDAEAAKKLLDLPEASAEEYAQVEGTWDV